jgi:hypothetical protein
MMLQPRNGEPPVPEYAFPERARIVDAFLGPEAESMTGKEALTQRIQVVRDLAALCVLRELSRRGKAFNWNRVEPIEDTKISNSDKDVVKAVEAASPTLLTPPSPQPSSEQCPFYFSDDALLLTSRMRPYSRIDSLRRHVLRVHLNQASRHATTTAFEVFLRLTLKLRTDRSSVRSRAVVDWSSRVTCNI